MLVDDNEYIPWSPDGKQKSVLSAEFYQEMARHILREAFQCHHIGMNSRLTWSSGTHAHANKLDTCQKSDSFDNIINIPETQSW
jgi:hypothetical protein